MTVEEFSSKGAIARVRAYARKLEVHDMAGGCKESSYVLRMEDSASFAHLRSITTDFKELTQIIKLAMYVATYTEQGTNR